MLIVVVALCWNGSHKLIAKYGMEAARDTEGHLLPIHHLVSIYLFFLQDMELVLTWKLIDSSPWMASLSLSLICSSKWWAFTPPTYQSLNLIWFHCSHSSVMLHELWTASCAGIMFFRATKIMFFCATKTMNKTGFFQTQNNPVHQENFLANLATKLFSHTILCSNES